MTRLEAERRRRGWTQTELGCYARLAQSEVSRLERRRALPAPSHAERLATLLGIPPGALLEEVGAAAEARHG
jgi:transcriptional regulator with XRE-family HTH domain